MVLFIDINLGATTDVVARFIDAGLSDLQANLNGNTLVLSTSAYGS